MSISARTKICMIIGDPVEHSLSPAMHNAAYRALGIDDQFVFVASRVAITDIETVVKAVRMMGIRGLTCTIPHKIEVMKYLDWIHPIAKKIGAVNTVVNEDGTLRGYNTDWSGVTTPLEQVVSLSGKNVALIGAGGASRAMAFGVVERGARLTIYNRTIQKAQDLAHELGNMVETRHSSALQEKGILHDVAVILNGTNLGMGETIDKTPVPQEAIEPHHIVFDAVYAPRQTRLLREAKAQGARVIEGIEMLLHQGTAQFELYTGKKAPVEVMRSALY